MSSYAEFYRRSSTSATSLGRAGPPDRLERAAAAEVCDYSNPPFARWFVGSHQLSAHNAVDRHLKDRASPACAGGHSTRTDTERSYEASPSCTPRCSAWRLSHDAGRKEDDRCSSLARLPRPPLMLACTWYRGAAFGGVWRFYLGLAGVPHRRCQQMAIVSADAGSRRGVPKPLFDGPFAGFVAPQTRQRAAGGPGLAHGPGGRATTSGA